MSSTDELDYVSRPKDLRPIKSREGLWPSCNEQELNELVGFLDRQSARSRHFEQKGKNNFPWKSAQKRPVTLKEALRRSCISHASEAAAMRKLSRPLKTLSEISDGGGPIKTRQDEEKRHFLETSEQKIAAFSRLLHLKEQALNCEEFRRRDRSKQEPKKLHLTVRVNDVSEACETILYQAGTRKKSTPRSMNGRIREKGECSQSPKSSSTADQSSSTSNSEESNQSILTETGGKPHMSRDDRWRAIRRVEMNQGRIRLKNFTLLRRLGCGDIGTVYVARLVGSECLFALKVMDEEFLWNRKKMPRAETEREILQMLDHPFLPTLYAHFSEDNLACLVMEYCPGGDLHVLRQRKPLRSFPEPAARFYVAEVLLALEYLHMLGVVYRDLKPENILVREDGHIMLSDFDLSLRCSVSPILLRSTLFPATGADASACIDTRCGVSCLPAPGKSKRTDPAKLLPMLVAEPTEARSNSFVGTHEYLAPEIIKGDGHGSSVDWWTLGIFLYELLYGRTPFKGSGNEETLTNIVTMDLRFPENVSVTDHARDLIRGLLVKDPARRVGSERGAAEIKRHGFFNGLNWALIRSTVPPENSVAEELALPLGPGAASGKKQSRCLNLVNDRFQFGLF